MSIFQLISDEKQLSSQNSGISKFSYQQISSSRDITTTNFPSGQQIFKFNTSGVSWWHPSKSFFRARIKLTDTDGVTMLRMPDGIGLSMNTLSSLYQSLEFRINDSVVSRCSSFVPQIDTLLGRINKSARWLEDIGYTSCMWQSDVNSRIALVSSDGYDYDAKAEKLSRMDLGFDQNTNQISVTVDSGVVTVSQNGGSAMPSLQDIFQPGDHLIIEVSDVVKHTYTVNRVVSATTLVVNDSKTLAIAATTGNFYRVRRSAPRATSFELIWQPQCLSVFQLDTAMVPGATYSFHLNPQSSSVYPLLAIETKDTEKVSGTDFKFEVQDMYFYAAMIHGSRISDGNFYLDLNETRAQTQSLSAGQGNSLTQKQFEVNPSTVALTLAFQDGRAGSSTIYSSSKLKMVNNEENKINRLFLSFAGQNLPSPDADPGYIADSVENQTQRYVETMLNTHQYFNEAGCETIQEWRDRGSYHYFNVPRDGGDHSTTVGVNVQFSTALSAASSMILFDHYRKVVRLAVKGGQVVEVEEQFV